MQSIHTRPDPQGRPKHWLVGAKLVAGATSAEEAEALALRAQAPASEADLRAVSIATIRREAGRRIRLLLNARSDDHARLVQMNALRRVARLQQAQLRGDALSEDDAAFLDRAEAIDAQIDAIRAASTRLEAAPPANVADDAHWPA